MLDTQTNNSNSLMVYGIWKDILMAGMNNIIILKAA